MAVSIQQAACNSLAAWLVAMMPSDVTVSTKWPSPDRPLPAKAITVLTAGGRKDTDVELQLISQLDIDSLTAAYTWQIKACEQAIQLDVWAKTDAERDDLLAQLDDVLNYGEAALGITGQFHDPARAGLLLSIADGWPSSIADFTFDGPNTPDDSDAVKRAEFRATIMGNALVALTVTRTSAKQIQIILEQRLNDGVDTDIMTITQSGETGSSGT